MDQTSSPAGTLPGPVPVGAGPLEKGLRRNAVGRGAAVVIGVASTAPAYSMASALGLLALATGLASPLVLVVSAVPMLLMAVAFRELNRIEPDCGTSFAWVSRALGPRLGWLAGWAVAVPCVLVMANLAQVAAVYTLRVAGADALAGSRLTQAVLGTGWIAVLTWLCYRGIRTTARLQTVLLALEAGLLVLLAVVALWKYATGQGQAGHLRLPELLGSGLGASQLMAGFMLAVFLYWGWDSAVAVNEETSEPTTTPGRAGLLALGATVLGYAVVSLAAFCYAGPEALAGADGDALAVLGPRVLGDLGGLALAVAVLTSAAASAQTTILPTARALLAMGTYRALPAAFGRIHPRYLTPSVATVVTGIASTAVFLTTLAISEHVLADSVTATALTITFYYALTGLACPLYFRRALRGPRNLLLRGVLPGLGGLVMAAAFVRSCWDLAVGEATAGAPLGVGLPLWIGAGSLLLGVVLMLVWQQRGTGFFAGRLAGPGDTVADGLARTED